jgi:dTDP-4-dehydrorhamnose reductase
MANFAGGARRPHFSAMTSARLKKDLAIGIQSWEEAVEGFFKDYPEMLVNH